MTADEVLEVLHASSPVLWNGQTWRLVSCRVAPPFTCELERYEGETRIHADGVPLEKVAKS